MVRWLSKNAMVNNNGGIIMRGEAGFEERPASETPVDPPVEVFDPFAIDDEIVLPYVATHPEMLSVNRVRSIRSSNVTTLAQGVTIDDEPARFALIEDAAGVEVPVEVPAGEVADFTSDDIVVHDSGMVEVGSLSGDEPVVEPLPTDLEALVTLARDAVDGISAIDTMILPFREQFENATADLFESRKSSTEKLNEIHEAIKVAALEHYKRTKVKSPFKGIQVKVYSKWNYDIDKAFAYCRENVEKMAGAGLAFMPKAFEEWLGKSKTGVEFATAEDVAQTTIGKELKP